MNDNSIALGKFLDLAGAILNDEQMMGLLNSDGVLVNGSVERDPERQLHHNDEVEIGDQIMVVDTGQQVE